SNQFTKGVRSAFGISIGSTGCVILLLKQMKSQASNPIAFVPDRLCSRSPFFPRALCFPIAFVPERLSSLSALFPAASGTALRADRHQWLLSSYDYSYIPHYLFPITYSLFPDPKFPVPCSLIRSSLVSRLKLVVQEYINDSHHYK
ncbi:MAG: hypothetical protein AB4426_20365, partial [Xenococcaceae cyanobacterium]